MIPAVKSDLSPDDFATALHFLKMLSATRSLNEKKEIILTAYQNTFFRTVVELALNPYLVFRMAGNIPIMGAKPNPDAAKLGLPAKIVECLYSFSHKSALTKQEKQEFSDLVRQCGVEAIEVVNRILNKDLRCGASIQTFRNALGNRLDDDALPVHHPMKGIDDLDKFYKAAKDNKNICWSIKLDGTRCHALVDIKNLSVLYLSSNGKELPNFHVFDKELIKAAGKLSEQLDLDTVVIFDGEVVNIQGDFSRHMSQFRRLKDMDASGFRFRIFDVLPITRPDPTPFRERYIRLNKTGLPVWTAGGADSLCAIVEHLPLRDSPEDLARKAIEQGFEGIMLKTYDGAYADKRVNYWCKIKAVHTEDLPVVDKIAGTGKYAGVLGALVVDRGGTLVEVGSGFTDAERKEFWDNPPKCIEVKYQEALASGSLRFPVFMRVRDDKA